MTPHSHFLEFFEGKTITLMGLGILGRGVGDAAFLARHCKKLFVTDGKDEAALSDSIDALKQHKNIEFFLGGHSEKHFENVDFVIKAAGVRLDSPYIAHAKNNGVPVYMSTALFSMFCGLKTIGVTGTRGKTTVTHMIAETLIRAGKKTMLGGNIRGVSTLAQLERANEYEIAVLELDSWQLQGFDDLRISPNIAVFTSFYPDHMNYYDGDMNRYLRDKSAVFKHQKPGDSLIVSADVAEALNSSDEKPPQDMFIAPPLPASFGLRVPGDHNLMNAGLAKAAAVACGVSETIVEKALREFQSVEGRLQLAGNWQGRSIYNDNNATTQEATLAALKAFPASSVVLIFGGADKGLPIDELVKYISENNIRSCLLKGSGSDRILQLLPQIPVASSMPDAIETACRLSKEGDNIILSPAFASFGMFNNEYDRNDQFMKEIKNLLETADAQ